MASQFVELPPLVLLSHKLKIIKQTENSLMLKMGQVQMVISDQLARNTMHLTDPKQKSPNRLGNILGLCIHYEIADEGGGGESSQPAEVRIRKENGL